MCEIDHIVQRSAELQQLAVTMVQLLIFPGSDRLMDNTKRTNQASFHKFRRNQRRVAKDGAKVSKANED